MSRIEIFDCRDRITVVSIVSLDSSSLGHIYQGGGEKKSRQMGSYCAYARARAYNQAVRSLCARNIRPMQMELLSSRCDRRCAIGRLANSRRCNDRVNDCVRDRWWSSANWSRLIVSVAGSYQVSISKERAFFLQEEYAKEWRRISPSPTIQKKFVTSI